MRAIKAAAIVMGVLIVVMTATLVVTIIKRSTGGSAPATTRDAMLSEPDGTRIAGIAAGADRVAIQLQGGGPDRVVVLDSGTGRVLLRAALSK